MEKKQPVTGKKRPAMDKNKKRRIIILSTAALLLISFTLTFAYLTLWRAPDVDDIYDRVVELVEGSKELNAIFYGAGLPTYSEDRATAEFDYRYFDTSAYPSGYEYLSDYTTFTSEQDIRDAAEKIYSKEFLENRVYPGAFVGYAVEDGAGGAVFAPARFLDEGTGMYVSLRGEDLLTHGTRVYDYSTMQVAAPSNARKCTVTIESYLPDDPSNVMLARISLVKQDDGQWYLDSLTV